jgi:hypothetical protein
MSLEYISKRTWATDVWRLATKQFAPDWHSAWINPASNYSHSHTLTAGGCPLVRTALVTRTGI